MDEMTQRFLTNMLIDAQALVEELRKPKPIDWPAEARKAVMMLWATQRDIDAPDACQWAEELIAEMKRREAFGGGG